MKSIFDRIETTPMGWYETLIFNQFILQGNKCANVEQILKFHRLYFNERGVSLAYPRSNFNQYSNLQCGLLYSVLFNHSTVTLEKGFKNIGQSAD